jgi:hypothetical protein
VSELGRRVSDETAAGFSNKYSGFLLSAADQVQPERKCLLWLCVKAGCIMASVGAAALMAIEGTSQRHAVSLEVESFILRMSESLNALTTFGNVKVRSRAEIKSIGFKPLLK